MNKRKREKESARKRGWTPGKKAFAVGLGLMLGGYITLTMVDPRAENWAGAVSPLLFVASFITISFGLYYWE